MDFHYEIEFPHSDGGDLPSIEHWAGRLNTPGSPDNCPINDIGLYTMMTQTVLLHSR